ncbi:3926_t:CDS:2 [Paraglomus brasilianum]|uniref:3926_t:CDS:1 n=1 Tax=Paraglomus brasilianum TaxID=144538 RepID=A0A9N9BIR8_9GLOM|nr:3926_t:CDS:2 [Paraglomus brasilianum]
MIKVESAHYQNESSQHVQAACAASCGGTWQKTLLSKPNSTFSQPSPVDSNRGSYSPNTDSDYINTNNYISETDVNMESDSAVMSVPFKPVVDCGAFSVTSDDCPSDCPSKRRRLREMNGQCHKKTDLLIHDSEGNTRSSISNQPITTLPTYSVTSQPFFQSPVQFSPLQIEQARGYQPPSPISRQNTSSSREFDAFSSSSSLTCSSVNEGIGSEGTQVVSAKHEPVYILHRKRPRHDSGLGYVEPLLLESEQEYVSDCSRTSSKDSIHKNGPFRPMAIPRSSSLVVDSNVNESAPVYAVKNSESSDYSILRMIPSLISEKNRKAAFVENLVDTAALIIDVVWSKFTVNPRARLIPMRVFLQQTLRRSRTSYSTLQTALFYLFRIKPQIEQRALKPRGPPTPCDKGSEDGGHNTDPATCGRRMFLAALIIASKYLQDSNYSNRAWSKISGLPLAEINENEVIFLRLIDYKLFIAEDVFKRWSSLLLTHIQAISGSDMDNANAFRLKENQQNVELFRDTLRTMVI